MLLSFSETDKPSVVPDPQHYSLTLPIKVESLAYRIIIAIEHRAFLKVSPNLSQAGSPPAGRYLDHCLCRHLVVFLHILINCAGLAPCWLIILLKLLSVYSLKAMFGRGIYLHASRPANVNFKCPYVAPEHLCLHHSLFFVVEINFFYPYNISLAVFRS